MAKLNIQQETFDNYVKENIEDLDMSPEEAVQDAIETCRVQGGDLFFVIKKNVESDGRHLIVHLIDEVIKSPTEASIENLINECKIFECRHFAANNDLAHKRIVEAIQPLNLDDQTEEAIILIRSLSVILRGQPDWVNRIIIQLISKLTKHWMKKVENPTNIKIKDFRFISAVARLIENCSKSHEENRCQMMEMFIQNDLCSIFREFPVDFSPEYEKAISNTIAALQAQLVDDDQRSEGCAGHQRARSFVVDSDLLSNSISLAKKLLDQNQTSQVGNKMIRLISSLLVSADFCNEAAKLGIGELCISLIREGSEDAERVKHCLNLIKALVGNDDVRHKLLTAVRLEEDVVIALKRHFGSQPTALAALRAITALTLRNPETARKVVAIGGAAAILDALSEHKDNKMTSRAALMAVRNCVVRSTELRPKFLELHAEILANEALEKFNLDEAKACLRDLGCEVKLKEIWTGSGKKLERGDGQRLKDLNIT